MSLLEMMIALVLIGVLVGIGAISYASGEEERQLRKTASQIEAMSSRGHAMSVLHQKPFWLRIEENKLQLLGADVQKKIEVDEFNRPLEWSLEEEQETHEVIYEEFSTEVEISVRRWGTREDEWVQPRKNEFLTWQFQSTGLCEPLSIRIVKDDNWIIMHMHPLTARVEEEEMHIR